MNMITKLPQSVVSSSEIEYPDSDGNPLSENTLQFLWIMTIQGGLDALFRHDGEVFVAGDNLIYPVKGDPSVRQAPDVYVVFGRPKGRRGSYKVWEEGGIFPQVVFEVLSPGNRPSEMARKLLFYEKYGVEEYYIYDPDHVTLSVYRRTSDDGFVQIETPHGYVSPRLGIRFDLSGSELVIYKPDGKPFQTYVELVAANEQATQIAEQANIEVERLKAKLRAAGIDPDEPTT